MYFSFILNCARDLYILFFQSRCSGCCCCNIRDKSQEVKTGQQNYYSICFCYFFKYYIRYISEYYVMWKSHVLVRWKNVWKRTKKNDIESKFCFPNVKDIEINKESYPRALLYTVNLFRNWLFSHFVLLTRPSRHHLPIGYTSCRHLGRGNSSSPRVNVYIWTFLGSRT